MRYQYIFQISDRLGDTYRWKGENVSASEVERIITTSDIVGEAVVYGTAIDGNEGKVGTAVLKRKAGQTIEISDIEKLVTACNENLLSAARPRIYRVQVTWIYLCIKSILIIVFTNNTLCLRIHFK